MAKNLRGQQNTGKISSGPPQGFSQQGGMYGDYDDDEDFYENDYATGVGGMGGMNMTGGARNMAYGGQGNYGGMNNTGGMYGGPGQGKMGQTGMSNLTQSKASYGNRPMTGMQGTMQSGYKTGFGMGTNNNMAMGYDYDSDDFDDGDLDYIDQMEGRPGIAQGGYGANAPGKYGMDMAGMNMGMGSDDYDDEYDDEEEDYNQFAGGMVADRNAFSEDDDDDEIDQDFDFDKNKKEFKKKEEEERKKESKAKEEEEKKKKELEEKKKRDEEDKRKRETNKKKLDDEKRKRDLEEEKSRREEVDRITREQEELARRQIEDRKPSKQSVKQSYYDDDNVNSEISGFGKEDGYDDQDDDYDNPKANNDDEEEENQDGYDSQLAELIAEQENQEKEMFGSQKNKQSENRDYTNDFDETEGNVESLKQDPNVGRKVPPKQPELKHSNYSFQPKESSYAIDQKVAGQDSPFLKNQIPGQHLVQITPGTYSGYAAEALLIDEQLAKKTLGTTLEAERDKAKSWEKQYWLLKEEKEKLETKYMHQSGAKEDLAKELGELKVLRGQFEAEIDELKSQLDIKDIKIDELQRANKALDGFNAQKERLLKEKREITEKSYMNSALDTMRKQHELEIESLHIKDELLQKALNSAEEKIRELEGDVKDGTGNLRMHAYHEHNVNDLKSQIAMLSNKLYERDRMKKLDDEDDDNNKEIMLMDIMIKGYAKENEKLIDENKLQKENINKMGKKSEDDKKEFNQTYAKMTHGSWMNNPENELKDNVRRLKEDLVRKDENYRHKMEEMSNQHKTEYDNLNSTWKANETKLVDEINRRIGENNTLRSRNPESTFTTDNQKLAQLEEINKDLENDLQENTTYYEAKLADLEANIVDMGKYYEKQNATQNNKALENLKKENKKLTTLYEELKRKTPKENSNSSKDLNKQIEDLKKDNKRLKDLNDDYRKKITLLESKKNTPAISTPANNGRKVPTKMPIQRANSKPIEDDEIFINTENMFNMLGKNDINNFSDEYYYDWNDEHNHYLQSKQQNLLDTVQASCPNSLITNTYNDIKIISEVNRNKGLNSRTLDAIDRLQEAVRNNRSINYSQEKYLNTTRAIKDNCDEIHNSGLLNENLLKKTNNHIYDLERIFVDDILGHLPELLNSKLNQVNSTANNFINNNNGTNQELERLKRGHSKLQEEVFNQSNKNAELADLIQNSSPNPSGTDFVVLQKRLELLEKNQKLKALEVQDGQKKMNFGTNQNGQNINFEREKQKYAEIIRKKNRDIAVFRHELDSQLLQIEELKKRGCPNCNYITR